MINSPEIFLLIRSMSAAEKRFFKLQAQGKQSGEGKNYLLLFDLLNEMEEFDGKILQLRAGELGFSRYLSWTQGHLMEQLLQSLRNFHQKNDPVLQVEDHLFAAKMLWRRGISRQSARQLEKARQLAETLELNQQMLEILEFERMVLIKEQQKGYVSAIRQLEQRMGQALHYLNTKTRIDAARQNLNIMAREQALDWARLGENTLPEVFLEDLPAQGYFLPRYSQLFGQALYHQITGDYARAFDCYGRLLTHFEENPAMLKAHQRNYVHMLNNYLNLAHGTGNYGVFPPTLAKLGALKGQNLEEEAEIASNGWFLRLLFVMNTGEFTYAPQLVVDIENGFEKYRSYINPARQIALLFNIAMLYFVQERFDLSWKWNQWVQDHEFPRVRKDIMGFSRLLSLIIAWERQELRLLESGLEATYKRIKRGRQRFPFELLIISHLKKLLASENKSQQLEIMQNFKEKLLKLLEKTPKAKFFGYAETLLWLNARLSGRPLREVLLDS
ncbi:MAG: hypothetical protein H6581_04200 [Bacteroidia bacterium]|nr:hypothetical protein [Bacteroidia bacterium]